jgi:hypothetical protein
VHLTFDHLHFIASYPDVLLYSQINLDYDDISIDSVLIFLYYSMKSFGNVGILMYHLLVKGFFI